MAKEKYKQFVLAFMTWLISDADLKTLTSYNATTNISIWASKGNDPVKVPGLEVFIEDIRPLNEEVDGGIYEAVMIARGYATSPVTAADIAGAVEELAKQDPDTLADASFSDGNVKTVGLRTDGMGAPPEIVPTTSDTYASDVRLRVLWKEVS